MAILIKNEPVDLMSEINITPMVDVMLVLLVVFIVSAPLMMHAVNVHLPKASADPMVQETKHIQINIMQTGDVYLGSDKLSLPQLEAQLALIASQPRAALEIYADTKVEYGSVAEVMAAIQRAKVAQFSFVLVPQAMTDSVIH